MANVTVSWELPTTRESGRPLNVADIAFVGIEISADLGVNFAPLNTFTPDVLQTVVTDLEPGEWQFRGTVVDSRNRLSVPVVSSIVIEDPTPPGSLLSLSLSL